MRKIIIMLVAIFVIISPLEIYASPTEDIRWVIDSRIQTINKELDMNYKSQSGLLRKLNFISSKILWVEFATSEGDNLNFTYSSQAKKEMVEDLRRDLVKFNEQFIDHQMEEDDSNFYVPLTFDLWEENGNHKKFLEEYVKNVIPNYIENLLIPLYKDYSSEIDETAKGNIIRDNQTLLKYSFRVLDTLTSLEIEFKNLTGDFVTVTRSHKAYEMLSLDSNYSYLVQRGKEIDMSEASIGTSTGVLTEGDYISRLAYAVRDEDASTKEQSFGIDLWKHSEIESEFFQLRESMIKIISAGAVYRPFLSKAGDPDFMGALESLYDDPEDKKKIVGLYQTVKEYKKPLFKTTDSGFESWNGKQSREYVNDRETSPSNNYEGTADIVYLKDFLKMIDSRSTFGLVMKQGIFRTNTEDMNSHSYYSDNPKTESLILSKGVNSDSGRVWTAPVLLYNGAKYQTGQMTGALTTYILRQIKAGVVDIDKSTEILGSILYINGVGDIVTEDNTVILPLAANPIMYKRLSDTYIPFTSTMMNHYPRMSMNGDGLFTSGYEGKYMVLDNYLDNHYAGIKMTGETNFDILDTLAFPSFRKDLAEKIEGAPEPFTKIQMERIIKSNSFWYNLGMKGTAFFKGLAQLEASNKSYIGPAMEYWVAIGLQDILVQGNKNLFSYTPHNDPGGAVANFYARNFYKSLTMDTQGMVIDSSSIIDHDYIFRNFLVEGLNGTLYAESYTKNVTTNASIDSELYSSLEKLIVYLGEQTLKAVGNKDSLLGMRNLYEDRFFGPVVSAIDSYLAVIMGIMLLLLLIRYLRERESFLRLVIFSVSVASILLVFVKVFPLYIPTVYNMVVKNVNNTLGYDILNIKTEKYDHTYGLSGVNDDQSKFLVNGTSLILYKFTDSQLRDFTEANNIETGTAHSGNIYMVDSVNGIYLEGNSLKVSTDVLFKNNPVTGSYEETDFGSVYQVTSDKLFSSSLDYYMPYFQIQEGLIESLNNIPKIFKVPLNSHIYMSGITKDSFMFFNYVNSAPFLSPSVYDVEGYGFTEEEINNLGYYYDNSSTGTNSYDFLNLNLLLEDPSDQIKETLWYRSLAQNGFLDSEEKYWRLIESVNLLTKKFMIKLGREVSLMSDENLIKVTSLFATTIFNQKISTTYNRVYPTELNYQEFVMEDVYLAALTDSVDKFIAEDLQLTSHVVRTGTFMAGISLIMNLWSSYIISGAFELLTLGVFLLYIAMWAIRFTFSREVKALNRGFTKVLLSVIVMATVFYSTFGIIDRFEMITSLIVLSLVQVVILYFLFVIISSILFNIAELGDGEFSGKMKGVTKLLKSLNTKINPMAQNRRTKTRDSRYREYARYDRDIDDDLDYIPVYKDNRRKRARTEPVYRHYDDEHIDELELLRREKERLLREKRRRDYEDLEG